ncbi:hypothetical protein AB7783_14005 [Tardiphaga sp. 172_B4_N1_3]|uniref:hypothetical protein n=1 Tax=Tardiphaga sp. 172_B4_N1_3 TaxID=3240787 RepID=UPI003F8ADA8C
MPENHQGANASPPEQAAQGTAAAGLNHQEIFEARRDEYNKLVASAHLIALILEKVDFKILPEALSADKTTLKRHLAPKTKIMSTGLDDGTCMASVTWDVGFKLKNKTVVKCSASYIISYDGVKDCTADGVTIFLENVGRVATYAYFRALYAQLDWSANLGSEPLPVIQFLPSFRKGSEVGKSPPPKGNAVEMTPP